LIAGLYGSLPRNNALCFYDWSDGSLLKSIPFFGPNEFGRALHAAGNTLAVTFPEAIRLFHTSSAESTRSLRGTSPDGSLIWLADLNRVVASKMVTSGTSKALMFSLMESGGSDSPKRKLNEVLVHGFSRDPHIRLNESNEFLICVTDFKCAVIKLGEKGAKLLWGAKPVGVNENLIPHPKKDLLWAGTEVLQMSSGLRLTKIKRGSFTGLKLGYSRKSACWLNDDRVVETVVEKIQQEDGDDVEYNRSLILWDTASGQRITIEPAPNCTVICATPDGRSVIEGTKDKRVRIRNAVTLKEEASFRAHDMAVTDIQCHPSRPLIVTWASQENLIRIWSLKDFSMIEELRINNGAQGVRVDSDGKKILVSFATKTELYSPTAFQD
jgi:WD40 repeat protein